MPPARRSQQGAAEHPMVPSPSRPPWPGVSQGKPRLLQGFLYQPKVSFTETAPKGEGWPHLGFSLCAAAPRCIEGVPSRVDLFASLQL